MLKYKDMSHKEQAKKLLEAGKSRSEIQKDMQKSAKCCRQIDYYIADARAELEAEQAEIRAEILAARKLRELEADAQIPTTAEILARLAMELNTDEPIITGFEVRYSEGSLTNFARLASETHRLNIARLIIAYNAEIRAEQEQKIPMQAILVINANEQLIENEEDLTE